MYASLQEGGRDKCGAFLGCSQENLFSSMAAGRGNFQSILNLGTTTFRHIGFLEGGEGCFHAKATVCGGGGRGAVTCGRRANM